MAKDPAFLFYSSDFLSGVTDLTMEERGQFITLLCIQHQKGRLTEKMIKISAPGVSKDVLEKFKVDESGLYYNERLEVEREKRIQHSEKQRQRAIEGWKKRKAEQSDGKATANATALPLENENVNEDVNKDESKNENKKPKSKKNNLTNHLFKNSLYYDYEKFEAKVYEDEKYQCFDCKYYYEAIKNWSDQGNMKKNWIATVKNWMIRDLKNNQAKLTKYAERQLNNQSKQTTDAIIDELYKQ